MSGQAATTRERLRALTQAEPWLGATELARRLGVSRSLVYKLLRAEGLEAPDRAALGEIARRKDVRAGASPIRAAAKNRQ